MCSIMSKMVSALERISIVNQTLQILQVMAKHLSVFLTYGDTNQIRTIFAVNSTLSDMLSTMNEIPLLTGCSVDVVM